MRSLSADFAHWQRAVFANLLPQAFQNPCKTRDFINWHRRCCHGSVNVSLYQASAALSANSRWQEIISENLASSSIPGFKKQNLSFEAVQAGLQKLGSTSNTATMPRVQATTNFTPGEMKMTGSKTDVAIDGPGFFEIQLPSGALGYTRDGEFQVNSMGQLTTKTGQLVMTSAGPVQFDLQNPDPISISSTGLISQGGLPKGKLKIVDFNDPRLLTPISGGCFLANNSGLQPTDLKNPSVRQGYLESANTTPVVEMANLVSVMRDFETNQKIIQLQDERMGKAISELGSPS